MAKPATDARLEAAAKGFTQVIGRGNAHIITRNPTTKKCCFDGQVGGGWHYADGLETDTAWQPGTAPWDWQMVKALYNAYALSNFSNGQIIKWVDPTTGQYVAFQPMALQWTNSLNQIQQISMPQSVAAQASDDILYWPAAYGAGRNFRYQASPLRLNKQLIIDSPSALPATTYDTLELNFIISVSSGVNIKVDGTAWDKKNTKNTANAIAFQLPGGAVLWSFAVPRALDSSGTPEGSTTGTMRLKKQGSSLYISVRFPKAWIDSIPQNNYPIIFDPTIDYQAGSSEDDGLAYSYNTQYLAVYTSQGWGKDTNGYLYGMAAIWSGVTIPAGATIDASHISFYGHNNYGSGTRAGRIYFDDTDSPTAPTTYAGFTGKTKTTASVAITTVTALEWSNSASLNLVISELVALYNYSAGKSMQVLIVDNGSSNGTYSRIRSWDYDNHTYGPKLHIEYTEAAGGDPEGSLIGGKLIRGGLLLGR